MSDTLPARMREAARLQQDPTAAAVLHAAAARLQVADLEQRWSRAAGLHVVRDGLGPCDECLEDVRGGTECSECLEDDGIVRHAYECARPGHL